jgi:hypothetical protein
VGGWVILKVSRLEVIQSLMEGLRDEEKVIKPHPPLYPQDYSWKVRG